MKNTTYIFLLLALIFFNCTSEETTSNNNVVDDSIYFPDANTTSWETLPITNLDWDTTKLDALLAFLETNGTKSFMILYNGRIVVETYMNGHDSNKLWYWASAGKTLTSTLSGIAEDEGLIDINHKVSDYLGNGWTQMPIEKEQLITCKHLLSMSSGLDDSLGDNVNPENLQYKADAGTRWAYHNVYKKMQNVLAEASGTSFKNYFNTKLRDRIGMSSKGNWLELNDFNVYWSNTRSMARFGLLIYAKGKWKNEQIVSEAFLNEATNTSQNMNKSYGYLWWLNGKQQYLLPGSQLQFAGNLVPNAPIDMFAAMGKNDQKIYIVPSKKLVIIRMGEAADDETFALSSFDNDLWEKINNVIK
ncbi:serine hydrolase [Seonamhaeicola algicola]|uniref:Serine hydrolase n=1 Tax=Seonamhaeicola algicola TaxID=1719036 RepID=A0A5C7ATQ4_9FLAO|nr:serine hydrolase [Seonamhaeicola algicola]TXE12058.1 serine hydrolase [Seonamhaeicola algicola]